MYIVDTWYLVDNVGDGNDIDTLVAATDDDLNLVPAMNNEVLSTANEQGNKKDGRFSD